MKSIVCFFLIILPIAFWQSSAEEYDPKSWTDYKKVIKESDIEYEFIYSAEQPDTDMKLRGSDLTILHQLVEEKDGSRYVKFYEPSDKAIKIFKKAESYFAEGKLDKAEKYYWKLLKIAPGFSKAYLCIGDCYYSRKDYKTAIKYFNKCLDANPMDFQAYQFMADCYIELGDLEKAKDLLVEAVIWNPRYKEAFDKLQELGKLMKFRYEDVWKDPPPILLKRLSDKKVQILFFSDEYLQWIGYGMCKAVRRYESGFTDDEDSIDSNLLILSPDEEAHCILYTLSTYEASMSRKDRKKKIEPCPRLEFVKKVLVNKDFREFIAYDLVSKSIPIYPALVGKERRDKMKQYFIKYHLIESKLP